MATADLSMDLPYTAVSGKPYVALVTGSDAKYGYKRAFVPSRTARGRNDKGGKVTAVVAEPGLYEMCDGDAKKYVVVLPAPGESYLADISVRDETAAELVAAFEAGRAISDLEATKSPKGKWTCRDAAGHLNWSRANIVDPRAKALATIRALMAEHGITVGDLA